MNKNYNNKYIHIRMISEFRTKAISTELKLKGEVLYKS